MSTSYVMERGEREQAALYGRLARYDAVTSPDEAPEGSQMAFMVAGVALRLERLAALEHDAEGPPTEQQRDVIADARVALANAERLRDRAWGRIEPARETLRRVIPGDTREPDGRYEVAAGEAWAALATLDAPRRTARPEKSSRGGSHGHDGGRHGG